MNKLIFLFLTLTLVSACGNKKSSSHKPKKQADPVVERELELTQREAVSFVRRQQMVTRYDCAGQITSRKLETTNYLSKKITINYEGRKKAWSYEVYNRRTKSRNQGAFTDDGKFVVDYAPTVFNMHVKEGINDIEYVFIRCTQFGKNEKNETICLKTEVEKEGLIQLDVTYSSEVLPNEQFIHPTCKE
jgi:hypothetical protein